MTEAPLPPITSSDLELNAIRARVEEAPSALHSIRYMLLDLLEWHQGNRAWPEGLQNHMKQLMGAVNRQIAAESPIHAEVKHKLNQDIKVRFDNSPVIHVGQLRQIQSGHVVVIPVEKAPTFRERLDEEIKELASQLNPERVAELLHEIVSGELYTLKDEVRHLVDDQLKERS